MCAPIHKVEVVETRKYHQLKHVRNPTSRVSPDCNCMPASCNAHLTFEGHVHIVLRWKILHDLCSSSKAPIQHVRKRRMHITKTENDVKHIYRTFFKTMLLNSVFVATGSLGISMLHVAPSTRHITCHAPFEAKRQTPACAGC